MAPSTSALVSMRTAPKGTVPSTVSVFGLITVTVFESWSAVYTRSLPEIGWAPGRAGAWVSLARGVPASCDPGPLAGNPAAGQAGAVTTAREAAPVKLRWRTAHKHTHA